MNKSRLIYIVALTTVMLAGALSADKSMAQARKQFVADKVIAVIGNEMILYSDFAMMEDYFKYQNRIPMSDDLSDNEKAELLNEMLLQKLLTAQARIDSLEVSPIGLENMVNEREEMFIEQYGSVEKLVEARNKPMFVIRDDIRKQVEETSLAQDMQSNVVIGVAVTPSEVNRIIKKIDDIDIPLVPVQYSYSQIIIKAPSTEAEKLEIKKELLELRKRIVNGDNFAALARMYSDDTGTAVRGGDLGFNTPQWFATEYADAMVSLQVGQVSNVIETEFGQHIILLEDKKGDKYRSRHILIKSKFSIAQLQEAMNELDSVRKIIVEDPTMFAQVAKDISDDELSKNSGGCVINDTQSSYKGLRSKSNKFFIDELGEDYKQLSSLKIGEFSEPFQSYDKRGNLVCKIVRLDAIVPEHKANIKDDYIALVDIALEKRKEEVFNEWLVGIIGKIYIRIEEPFRSYEFEDINWVK